MDFQRQDSQMPLNEENGEEDDGNEEEEEKDEEEEKKIQKFDQDFQKYQIELKQASASKKKGRRNLNRIVSSDNFSTSIGRSPSEFKQYYNNKFYRDQFKQFITTTYNDWYYDRTEVWDYIDFYEVIALNPNFDHDLGPFLCDDNILSQ